MASFPAIALISVLLSLANNIRTEAQLSPTFYHATCPKALDTIRTSIRRAVSRERRMLASLLRLHFHDCFVQGCDGSVLLDKTPTIQTEKTAVANNNSARGFEVIEAAKRESSEDMSWSCFLCRHSFCCSKRCISCCGSPTWQVKLGRRDSTTANRSAADSDLPSPFASLGELISNFKNKGLTERDMVALSGSHTIGQARCFLFRNRIYTNGTDIDAGFATTRRRQCPATINVGDSNLAPLDLVTPNTFDSNYFKNLMQKKGLLTSDQVLFNGGSTDSIVSEYSRNPRIFLSDFASAMVKMGDIEPLPGANGIIRKICSAKN